MSDVNKADLADKFFSEFEEQFPLIAAACDGIGPSGPWTITDADNLRFRLWFAFEEKSNGERGLTLVIKEFNPGPGNAGLFRRTINFVMEFAEQQGLQDLVIGTPTEDTAGRQRFVDAICAITPRLQPAEDGCARARLN